MPAVTQAQYIAHYEAVIVIQRKMILDGINTLGYYQMQKIMDAVQRNKKRIGFARSGKMKEFFID